MRQHGFSLIELLVIIAISSALLAIATLQFNQYTQKANIESQVRTMYADLVKVRSEALMQKVTRSIGVTDTQFKVYPLYNGGGAPILVTTFKYPVSSDYSDFINFDSRGVASDPKTVCVEPDGNPAVIDSIRITETMIQLGKRSGGACDSAHFTAR